jgi:hypothetical protein
MVKVRLLRFNHRTTNDEERGAILMLALILMLLVSLTIAGLLQWVNTDLSNSTNFQAGNVNQQSSSGAVNIALQTSRYATWADPFTEDCSNPTMAPFTDSASGMSSAQNGTFFTNGSSPTSKVATLVPVQVWCSGTQAANGNATNRDVKIVACPVSMEPAGCSATNPYLSTEISFVDQGSPTTTTTQNQGNNWNNGNSYQYSYVPGLSQTITNWVYSNQTK